MNILGIYNHGGSERDFHGPSYFDAFEKLGHTVHRIAHTDAIPGYDYDFMFHFYHSIDISKVDDLKKHGVVTALLLGDEPCEFNRTKDFSPAYDIVFNQTGGDDNIEAHKALGANMHRLPHCTDPDKYFPVTPDGERYSYYGSDVAFIGTLTKRYDREYIRSISDALRSKGLSFKTWGPGTEHDFWVGHEMVSTIYASSKVIFNPSAVADQPNWDVRFPMLLGGPACRIFNTAACRAFQVAPRRPGFPFQPFVEGEEIVYYDHTNLSDIILTIEDSLDKGDEYRTEIANRGYDRVLSEHTYVNRAAMALEHINKLIGKE